MTLNPPEAVVVLAAWRDLQARQIPQEGLPLHLDLIFRRHLGRMTYDAFLSFWHLHLQLIPFDLARTAWGLTQTAA
jgi:hypothetical protein